MTPSNDTPDVLIEIRAAELAENLDQASYAEIAGLAVSLAMEMYASPSSYSPQMLEWQAGELADSGFMAGWLAWTIVCTKEENQ